MEQRTEQGSVEKEGKLAFRSLANFKPRAHLFDIDLVVAELNAASEKLDNIGPAVSIFGSARLTEESHAYQQAFEIAEKLSQRGVAVITGGGPGIMKAGNSGCKAGNALSIGLNIKLPKEQFPNEYQDLSLSFEHFLTRKTIFMAYSEAFICLAGGFGTLDELIEAITLMQTKKMAVKPIILVDRAFWEPLFTWFKTTLVREGLIAEADLDKFQIVDSSDEVIDALEILWTKENSAE
ncbi:TIGR00730 family Rossman fold protein [Ignatzschineria ureiclastica]|uniref:Cytokinin riboside 5'-monophosphate phosphoribohydrolase n=1 Tax=Ignatzschineria ureiclastica TaxID=472582 RepID=A0A2U2AET1_9GAMM|nr:TIGR00730 family Rossman fold protein [Ignatzschineria ureiclastica]PWD81162.1 TIGR00730 family Rossman fold protein [Ignatzschineria ureiclastica]GGZ96751.1 cytokinin riboside 5'-monophosphate phosphoribohydrolase [Ignatzschineria ureiclastica]